MITRIRYKQVKKHSNKTCSSYKSTSIFILFVEIALIKEQTKCVEVLLEKGASVKQTSSKSNWTAIQHQDSNRSQNKRKKLVNVL